MIAKTMAVSLFAFSLLLIGSPLAAVSFAATPNVVTTWYVAPSPTGTGTSGGSCSAPGFNDINLAIAAAHPGDTIFVCAGTYQEQVTVDKTLTLTGVGSPTIEAPATMAGDSFGYLNIVTVTGPIVTTISGFTIEGPLSVACNSGNTGTGVFVQNGATANIKNNIVTMIHDDPIVQCEAYGVGILVGRSALGTTGYATISHNTISDYQKGGVVVDGTGSTATITGNTITGWTASYQTGLGIQIAQNGVQISRGAVATVKSNTISDNQCPVDDVNCGPNLVTMSQATGVLTYMSGAGTTVTGNTFTYNDLGILVLGDTASQTSNKISYSTDAGILQSEGTGTYTASKNTLSNNPIGIAIVSDVSTFTSNVKSTTFTSDPIHIQVTTVTPGGLILKFAGHTFTISGDSTINIV